MESCGCFQVVILMLLWGFVSSAPLLSKDGRSLGTVAINSLPGVQRSDVYRSEASVATDCSHSRSSDQLFVEGTVLGNFTFNNLAAGTMQVECTRYDVHRNHGVHYETVTLQQGQVFTFPVPDGICGIVMAECVLELQTPDALKPNWFADVVVWAQGDPQQSIPGNCAGTSNVCNWNVEFPAGFSVLDVPPKPPIHAADWQVY